MGYVYFTGKTYFITCKTFADQKFFQQNWQKQILLDQLAKAQKKFNIKIFGFVFLSNHYHLLIKSNHWQNVPKFIQLINGGSSFILNKKENFDRRGIWHDRWAKVIDNDNALFNITGYILENPYKHGLVKNLLELYRYRFSSYNQMVNNHDLEYIDNMILRTIPLDLDLESEENYIKNEKKPSEK